MHDNFNALVIQLQIAGMYLCVILETYVLSFVTHASTRQIDGVRGCEAPQRHPTNLTAIVICITRTFSRFLTDKFCSRARDRRLPN